MCLCNVVCIVLYLQICTHSSCLCIVMSLYKHPKPKKNRRHEIYRALS